MAGVWVSSYCLNTEGFPKILYVTLQRLGIREHPEYEGREYMKHGTERCKVTVYIGKSEEFLDVTEAWNVTAPASATPTKLRLAKPCGISARSMKGPLLVLPCGSFPLGTRIGGYGGLAWRLCKV
jgi:hypothetical protein